ncbi:aminotransferase class V-fold PLP-dependent enzyme [Lutimaribacter marinistellae]|uniref:Aminotransferase class V-fold PLP-dependent enzyme n=1 Tax=Lutimaribacter marinistellae TaxID=1820329 RepID=A0ABV7TIB9_9RHOB
MAYFYYHSIGQYPGKEAALSEALQEFAGYWSAETNTQWQHLMQARGEYVSLWSNLIEAPEGSLTASENVTQALHSVLGALPPEILRGKRLLVAADCFPSLHFLLAGLADKFGFTLDTVPIRQGETWVRSEDMLGAWGKDVGLALLTWITSTSSYRCDLDALVAHGREMGSVIGVDITQGAGLLPFSVQKTPCDFAVSTSLKWLCGPPGAGMLYMRPELIERAEPELRGWFSQPDPFNWDITRFSYAPDARRFDHGTPAALPNVAALPALRWHSEQEHGALAQHTYALSDDLIGVMDRHDLSLASPRAAKERGGSVMATLRPDRDAGALVASLLERGIVCDNRSQVLRFSPGIITTREDVEALDAALGELL